MVLEETVSGNDLERNVGPTTFVDIVLAAASTRSYSTKIFGRFGATDARTATTPSGPSLFGARLWPPSRPAFSGVPLECVGSEKVMGRVVKSAARSRRNRS